MKIYSPSLKAKTHQTAGIEKLISGNQANFDDQGLGKCKQAYDTIGYLLETDKIDLAVVISKSSLKQNFFREISADAQQLISVVVDGPRASRLRKYKYPACHVLILSFENVVQDLKYILELFKKHRIFLALDEAHYVKNPEALRTAACIELSKLATIRSIFTGTPAPNKARDLYSQFKFLGYDVGETPQDFQDRFTDPSDLRDFMVGKMVRRKKENVPELKIPGKSIHTITVKLGPDERKAYDLLNDRLILELRNKYGTTKEIPIKGALSKLQRLIQFTSNSEMFLSDLAYTPAKIAALDKLVEDIVGKRNEKVIIWTTFRHNVEFLVRRYSLHGAMPLYGGLKKKASAETVNNFKDSQNHKIIIAIPACAREGFTLTKASNAIYLDRNFSFLDWAQSQDRIHRISQVNPCHIYVLQGEDTIDENIDDILDRKNQLQAFLLGDSETSTHSDFFTLDEIEKLLKPKVVLGKGDSNDANEGSVPRVSNGN